MALGRMLEATFEASNRSSVLSRRPDSDRLGVSAPRLATRGNRAAVLRRLLAEGIPRSPPSHGIRRTRTESMEELLGSPEFERPVGAVQRAFDVVALAASAGGLRALSEILATLPAAFPAGIVVVQHLDPRHRSLMAGLLARKTKLRVKEAEEDDRVGPSSVFIAPPNKHLLVNPDGSLSLTQTELVHFVRPSVDLLFESVAASYRGRAIAVVLTGTGTDGAMGVRAIKKMGGTVIAQDELTSEFFGMPGAAIGTGDVDFVLPLQDIADALVKLVDAGEVS